MHQFCVPLPTIQSSGAPPAADLQTLQLVSPHASRQNQAGQKETAWDFGRLPVSAGSI